MAVPLESDLTPRSPWAADFDHAPQTWGIECCEPSDPPPASGGQYSDSDSDPACGPGILESVGFNPHRIHRRRPSDYVFVVAAIAAGLLLLTWALAG